MKKLLILFVALFFISTPTYVDAIERTWPFHDLTGGGSGSLDGSISGVSPEPTDQFIGIDNETLSGATFFRFYRVVTDGTAEAPPYMISADDIGAGDTRYALVNPSYLSGTTLTIIISSPDGLDDLTGQQPIWINQTARPFVITNGKFICSDSGNTIEGISYSTSETNYRFGSGTTIFNFISMSTAGTSMYYTTETAAGTTSIPTGRAVLMDYGVATADWLMVIIGGYFQ